MCSVEAMESPVLIACAGLGALAEFLLRSTINHPPARDAKRRIPMRPASRQVPKTVKDLPSPDFMDETVSYDSLMKFLPPHGLCCPRCQARRGFKVHRRRRE